MPELTPLKHIRSNTSVKKSVFELIFKYKDQLWKELIGSCSKSELSRIGNKNQTAEAREGYLKLLRGLRGDTADELADSVPFASGFCPQG